MADWSSRDWKWVMFFMITVIVILVTLWLGDFPNIGGYLTVFSTAVTVALAFVAIYIALKQERDSQRINSETQQILARMDERLNSVNDKVSSIDVNNITKIVNENLQEYTQSLTDKINKDSGEYNKDEVIKLIEEEMSQKIDNIHNDLKSSIDVSNYIARAYPQSQIQRSSSILNSPSLASNFSEFISNRRKNNQDKHNNSEAHKRED